MPYIGTQPKDIRSFGKVQFDFTATQGQTAFTGADDDGKTLGFTEGQIQVYVNGVLMDASDYTTSNTNTVTLVSAANLNDIITVVALQTDIPNSDYVPASGGTFTGDVTHNGDVGIGTSSPVSKLTVENAQGDTLGAAVSVRGSGSYDAIIEVENTTTTNGGRGFLLATDDTWTVGSNKVAIGYGPPSSSNTAIVVDSSNRVTTPSRPAFDVALDGSNYTTANPVIFDEVYHNVGSHYSTTTGRFTCPVAGMYLFYTSHIRNGGTAVSRRRFNKNGSATKGSRHQRLTESSISTYGDNGTFFITIECAAGDYITVDQYVGSVYGSREYDYFGGYLIG